MKWELTTVSLRVSVYHTWNSDKKYTQKTGLSLWHLTSTSPYWKVQQPQNKVWIQLWKSLKFWGICKRIGLWISQLQTGLLQPLLQKGVCLWKGQNIVEFQAHFNLKIFKGGRMLWVSMLSPTFPFQLHITECTANVHHWFAKAKNTKLFQKQERRKCWRFWKISWDHKHFL